MGAVIPQVIVEDRASGAQVIDGSLKFDSSATNYLKKIPYVGNRKTWTISFWVKRSEGTSNEPGIFSTLAGSNPAFTCYFNAQDNLRIYDYTSSYTFQLTTNQVFRDYNSWYHIVISIDTTQTTVSDRVKLYVNGVRVTDFDAATESYPGPNVDLDWNTAYEHNIGRHSNAYDGNISNFYHIDGHSFGPEYFGFTDPLTNTWRPKKLEQFPKRSFTNPRWYSSATVYTSVADVVANATDRGNGGVTVTNEYCYLVFNDGGYATSGGVSASPDYPIWTDIASFSGITRVFYYDSGEADNWANAGSFSSTAGEWSQWRYSNASSYEAYRISPYMGIENGNMLVFCANANVNTPTLAGTLASITLPTFDTNSFHFQNAAVDTWYTGGNSFYLPFDGNSPIGEDRFNNENNWTPQYNFGGSNTIEKATGALPILNTVSGGRVATVGVRTDATVAAGVGTCALALPLLNSKEDVSNEIDSKSSQKSISINGDPTGITTVSNFYGGSYYFDGSGDYLNTTSVYSDLNFKTGDFTIEAWCYASSSARAGLWQLSYTSGGLRPDDLQLSCHYQNTKFNFGSAGGSRINGKEYSTNRWHHVAEVRKDGVISTYINGVLDQSWTDTSTYWEGDTYVCVGGYWNTSYLWNGYIQDFRIYNGVAKYTENFIPASTNPDILPDTPSGVSGSSKLDKIIDGAVYFDGIDDYLTIPWSSDFDLGQDSDFTIEFFVNFQDDATTSTLLSWGADEGNRFDIGCQSANDLRVFAKQGGSGQFSHNATIIPGKWHHVALVRHVDFSGSTDFIGFYIDGIARYTINGNPTMPTDTSNGIDIGRRRYGTSVSDYFRGYISNLRIIKGSAAYPYDPDNITVPTEPLTNVTNTKLLCCQDITNTDNTWNTRMFVSDSAHTDKAGVLANGTEVFGGESITNKYIFIVPNSNDPSSSSDFIWSDNGALTNSDTSQPPTLYRWHMTKRVSGNWIHTQGSYASDNYDQFYYGSDTDSYQLDKTHDFYGLSVFQDGNDGPGQFSGTLPHLSRYLSTPVSPSSVKTHGGVSLSNFNPFNTDINTVRGQETGYCTLNPLFTGQSSPSLSNGNLTYSHSQGIILGTMPFGTTGKWFFEVEMINTNAGIGIALEQAPAAQYVGYDTNSWTYYSNGNGASGGKYTNYVSHSTTTSYGAGYTAGDVIGVALDRDTGELSYYKNGVYQGVAFTGFDDGKDYFPAVGSGNLSVNVNFGQKPFKFPPPDGFQPLNSVNIRPETIVARPDQYVGVTTYTGNAPPGSTNTQSFNIGFKPDLLWFKVRTATSNNFLFDTVRTRDKVSFSNTAANDSNCDSGKDLVSFDYNGFTVGEGNQTGANEDGEDIVAWAWKAGGNSNTYNVDDVGYATAAAAGLDGGTITPTGASIGTKQGFSIIAYTGNGSNSTISHGLTKKPQFILAKNRDSNFYYHVYHAGIGYTKYAEIYESLGYFQTNAAYWTAEPTSSVFSIGIANALNKTDDKIISYLWHDVPGLQKFGIYEGNADTDGPYVELGFKPAILMLKNADAAEHWYVYDSERSSYNPAYQRLLWSSDAVEENSNVNARVDLLSSGFKLRQTNAPNTANTYIYAAWAKTPAINLYGATSNAR